MFRHVLSEQLLTQGPLTLGSLQTGRLCWSPKASSLLWGHQMVCCFSRKRIVCFDFKTKVRTILQQAEPQSSQQPASPESSLEGQFAGWQKGAAQKFHLLDPEAANSVKLPGVPYLNRSKKDLLASGVGRVWDTGARVVVFSASLGDAWLLRLRIESNNNFKPSETWVPPSKHQAEAASHNSAASLRQFSCVACRNTVYGVPGSPNSWI